MARNSSSGPVKALLIVLICIMIAATGLVVYLCINLVNQDAAPSPPQSNVVTLPGVEQEDSTAGNDLLDGVRPTETLPPGPQVVSTATVGAMGDLLMHIQLLNTSKVEGGYDFTPIFKYVAPYIAQTDLFTANLETTFGGDKYPYQGNPALNTPDPFARDLKNVGFDMLLTANNHCGDTRLDGLIRTVQTLEENALDALGTQKDPEAPKYLVRDVGGIKLGMVCYTYATAVSNDGRPQLNLNAYLSKPGYVNFFRDNNLDKFYEDMQTHLDNMKAEGAEATVVFLHWGTEYKVWENDTQKAIAQKLCDMGVDAIVGSHPHVIQPMDLLESTVDPEHKTVVIYSMGNAISNQRRSHMRLKTGHTEDGGLFTLTFEKYDDGAVRLADANVLPLWVQTLGNDRDPSGYRLLPLDETRRDQWGELFDVKGNTLAELSNAYSRTMEIVGEGLKECKDYFAQSKGQQ